MNSSCRIMIFSLILIFVFDARNLDESNSKDEAIRYTTNTVILSEYFQCRIFKLGMAWRALLGWTFRLSARKYPRGASIDWAIAAQKTETMAACKERIAATDHWPVAVWGAPEGATAVLMWGWGCGCSGRTIHAIK